MPGAHLFTGSDTLLRGGGFLRFSGTGCPSALATVFRGTRYFCADARPVMSGFCRLFRRIRSYSHSLDLCTHSLLTRP
ncbi:hypothetical protein CG719_13150 [Streptomyces sp. CB01373]|nr:hypothetical protein CG719_13150 [Streptomyces sp. CB01373]